MSNLVSHLSGVPLYCEGVGARAGSSQEWTVAVTHDIPVIIIHTEKSYRALCCALIGEEGRKDVFSDGGRLQHPVTLQLPLLGEV